MAAENLVNRLLYQIRMKFYPDNEKGFYQERTFLIRSITYPAHWLWDRKVKLPEARLEEILAKILRDIMHHGNTGKIGFFSAYLLKVVQEHMSHHGEDYYNEAKDLRKIVDSTLENLTEKQRKRLPDALDPVTVQLADLNRLVRATKLGRRKKPDQKSAQLDLF